MKRRSIETRRTILACMAAAALLAGCRKGVEEASPSGEGFLCTAQRQGGDSKTGLGNDGATVNWKANDEIKVFADAGGGGSYTLTAQSDGPTSYFTGNGFVPDGTKTYYAYYPADNAPSASLGGSAGGARTINVTLPATQTYVENSFGNGANPMAAVNSEYSMAFKNLCGVLMLQLWGDYKVNKIVVTSKKSTDRLYGSGTVTFNKSGGHFLGGLSGGNKVTLNCGDVQLSTSSSSPTKFYIVLPANTLASGFKMDVYVPGSNGGTPSLFLSKSTDKDNTTVANNITQMGIVQVTLPPDLSYYKYGTQQSTQERANCYVVHGTTAKDYRFPCDVKGNGVKSGNTHILNENPKIVGVDNVVLVWETKNEATAPTAGSIISSVELIEDNTYVKFHHTGTPGNALIAVRDSQNNILWSWHIWCTGAFDPENPYDTYTKANGTKVMRCNLGALSAYNGSGNGGNSLGLLYQWGRKDPFTGGYDMSSSEALAKSMFSIDNVTDFGTSTTLGLDESVKFPYKFITNSSYYPYDWFSKTIFDSDGLWGSVGDDTHNTKTMYDPCPPGWRVPGKVKVNSTTYITIWNAAMNYSDVTSFNFPAYPSWDITHHVRRANNSNNSLVLSCDGSHSANNNAYYPALGFRNFGSGELYYIGSCGDCWSATPDYDYVPGFMYDLRFDINSSGSSVITPAYLNARAAGFCVRPIRN